MRVVICLLCVVFVAGSMDAGKPYHLGDCKVIFSVRKVKGPNKNNDQIIYRYLKRVKTRQSHLINKNYSTSTYNRHCLIFYWKNISTNAIGFVIAYRKKSNKWMIRQNGQKRWSSLSTSDNTFKWINSGRSVGITLYNENPKQVSYLFSGAVDITY